MAATTRPAPSEYAPYYARYLALVPDGSALDHLKLQIAETLALLRTVPEDRAEFRYATGKWSVKEVVGHIADSERVFAYRAMRFARNDRTPLPGFDEKEFIANSNFARRPLADVAAELAAVRGASIALFGGLDDQALGREGTANEVKVSVRALLWIIAGHELHHRNILKERYL